MSKAYKKRRLSNLARKAAKSKLKAKVARIKKQQKTHEGNVERAVIRRLLRQNREERGK